MTVSPATLQPGIQLAASTASPILAPVTAPTTINSAVFSNVGADVNQVSVYLVRSGGQPGPINLIIPAQTLAVGQTYVAPELWLKNLGVGDSLWAFATNANQVNCVVDGFTTA